MPPPPPPPPPPAGESLPQGGTAFNPPPADEDLAGQLAEAKARADEMQAILRDIHAALGRGAETKSPRTCALEYADQVRRLRAAPLEALDAAVMATEADVRAVGRAIEGDSVRSKALEMAEYAIQDLRMHFKKLLSTRATAGGYPVYFDHKMLSDQEPGDDPDGE